MVDIVALRRRTDHPTGVAETPESPAAPTPGATAPGTTPRATAAQVIALVRSTGLAGLVRPAAVDAGETGPDSGRLLPVLPELRRLLPWGGLRRGATIGVAAAAPPGAGEAVRSGATTVLLSLLAAASASGSWCAVIGMPALGAGAAAEMGIALERLALVPHPGPEWISVVAALLDGMDVVVTAPPGPVSAAMANRLAARARQRGSVLVPYGRWPGADLVLEPVGCHWHGLGQGRGRLRQRELIISAAGRGAAARPRRTAIWLPADPGRPPVDPGQPFAPPSPAADLEAAG